MTEIIPLVFEDHLVRVIERDGEPWFVGKDVCVALDIRNANDALGRLDDDERGVGITDPPRAGSLGGGQQEAIIVSEAGVYRLVFTSRKAEAERFKRWLAHEVLPQLRKTGRYALAGASPPPAETAEGPVAMLNARVSAVREARLLFGPARAARLWGELGLPAVPGAPAGADADDREALNLMLFERVDEDGSALRDKIEAAVNDDLVARAICAQCGVRIVNDREEGVIVANDGTWLRRLFDGTPWSNGRWRRALRRLPGARPTGPMRFGEPTFRGTFVPLRAIDDAA